MMHELKADPEPYRSVALKMKKFELRYDDRGFQVGDTLLLRETKSTGAAMAKGAPLAYTGHQIAVTVLHLMRGPVFGLAGGWVIMSISEPIKL